MAVRPPPSSPAPPKRRTALLTGLVDPRVHPQGLDDRDLETLLLFGVTGVVVVADATATPRSPEGLFAHFEHLLEKELPRLQRAGLKAWAALGVHPAVVPRRGLLHVLETLPSFLSGGRVVALGLLGLSRGGEHEEEALLEQLALARRFNLPALVTTPAAEREAVTRRLLTVLRSAKLPAERILVDGAVGRTVRIIRELGFHAGLTLHPDHLTVERAVSLVRQLGPERLVLSSAAGDGASELLALSRAANRLLAAGLSRRVAERVARDNAAALLGLHVG
ncbi:MAG: TatD family hydrolase [Myxococcota bacterium]